MALFGSQELHTVHAPWINDIPVSNVLEGKPLKSKGVVITGIHTYFSHFCKRTCYFGHFVQFCWQKAVFSGWRRLARRVWASVQGTLDGTLVHVGANFKTSRLLMDNSMYAIPVGFGDRNQALLTFQQLKSHKTATSAVIVWRHVDRDELNVSPPHPGAPRAT